MLKNITSITLVAAFEAALVVAVEVVVVLVAAGAGGGSFLKAERLC